MFMIKLEIAKTEREYLEFQNAFCKASRSDVSLDYLRSGTVLLAKKSGRVIGGAVCNSAPNFRYCDWWNELSRAPILAQSVEYACLWASQSASKLDAHIMQIRIFYECHRLARMQKKSFVIAGTLHPKLAATQAIGLNIPLYEGPFAADPTRRCFIYASHEDGVLKRMVKSFFKELGARLKKKSGSKRVPVIAA